MDFDADDVARLPGPFLADILNAMMEDPAVHRQEGIASRAAMGGMQQWGPRIPWSREWGDDGRTGGW